jgi:hypothetical protein
MSEPKRLPDTELVVFVVAGCTRGPERDVMRFMAAPVKKAPVD